MLEFGHPLEVHPVDRRDCQRDREDRRPSGQLLRHLVLRERDQQQVRFERRIEQVAQIVDAFHDADHVVLNVAEVIVHGVIDQRHVVAHDAVAHFLQRLHGAAQQQQLVPQLVDALDVGRVAAMREHLFLQRVRLGFQLVQDGEVVVDDEVDDRIDDEALALRQHLRRAFGARAHFAIGRGRAVAHGDHVARSRENVRLAELDLLVDDLRGAQRHEDRVPVDLELRALMREQRVLDREVVQVEALLHGLEQVLVRRVQPDPDERAVLVGTARFGELDLGVPPPRLVGNAVDDGTHACLPGASAYDMRMTPRRQARGKLLIQGNRFAPCIAEVHGRSGISPLSHISRVAAPKPAKPRSRIAARMPAISSW